MSTLILVPTKICDVVQTQAHQAVKNEDYSGPPIQEKNKILREQPKTLLGLALVAVETLDGRSGLTLELNLDEFCVFHATLRGFPLS